MNVSFMYSQLYWQFKYKSNIDMQFSHRDMWIIRASDLLEPCTCTCTCVGIAKTRGKEHRIMVGDSGLDKGLLSPLHSVSIQWATCRTYSTCTGILCHTHLHGGKVCSECKHEKRIKRKGGKKRLTVKADDEWNVLWVPLKCHSQVVILTSNIHCAAVVHRWAPLEPMEK